MWTRRCWRPPSPSLVPPEQQQLPPPPPLEEFLEAQTPEWLLYPITLQLLDDPVLLVGDGCIYSRAAIEEHLAFCRQSKWD